MSIFGVLFLARSFFGGGGDVVDMDPGDCFDDPTLLSVETSDVESVDEKDCDEPHHLEALGTYVSPLLSSRSGYPSASAIADEAFPRCASLLASYSGVPYGQSLLDVTFYYPVLEDWSRDHRAEILCVAHASEPLTNSIRNRGEAYPLPCFSVPDVPVECSEPHDHELYAYAYYIEGADGSFPGIVAISNWADAHCSQVYQSLVSSTVEQADYEKWWLGPTTVSWDQGDRLVACYVALESGEQIVGSATWRG